MERGEDPSIHQQDRWHRQPNRRGDPRRPWVTRGRARVAHQHGVRVERFCALHNLMERHGTKFRIQERYFVPGVKQGTAYG